MVVTLTINLWWVALYLLVGYSIYSIGKWYADKIEEKVPTGFFPVIAVVLMWPLGLLQHLVEGDKDA